MPTRVVLVDDVAEVRQMVRTALRFRGDFEVVAEAADGATAVSAVAAAQPDVVVLDLGLPDLAGREVLARIRASSPHTKVVVFTGTDVADRDWIAERADGFVLKGQDLDYLVDLLAGIGRSRELLATTRLTRDRRSVQQARTFVQSRLSDWQATDRLDDALLVVSELVTNAIMHADSECELTLALEAGALRVEVLDDGTGTPDPVVADTRAEGGRGLHLVAAISAAWGVDTIPDDGKRVWAELLRTG